jgi:hypothetical protein
MIAEMAQKIRRMRESSEPGELEDEIVDGVLVNRKLFYHDYKQTRWEVSLDGTKFACELETWPGNFMKDITTSFWVWTGLTMGTLNTKLVPALPSEMRKDFNRPHYENVERVAYMEDFYPPEGLPMHYNLRCWSIEDVVAIWKAYLAAFGSYSDRMEFQPTDGNL